MGTWLLAGPCFANKTDCITAGISKRVDLTLVLTPSKHKTFVSLYTMLDQRRKRLADVV